MITIDGQNISYLHFFQPIKKETLFIVDLCALSTVAKKLLQSTTNILYTQSAHPLCTLASHIHTSIMGEAPFLSIDVSSGTVAGAALDFAQKVGFTKIVMYGCDFAYNRGKPYAQGTYLDTAFNTFSTRVNSTEMNFCTLMFRTPLREEKFGKTTETLLQYAKNLSERIDSLEKKGITVTTKNSFGFNITPKKQAIKGKKEKKNTITAYSYLYLDFKCRFIKYMESTENFETVLPSILPLVAWIRQQNRNELLSNSTVFHIAKSKMERYI